MRGGNAIDQEFFAGGIGKVEKAADVVVLVVGGKEPLGFGGRKAERRKGDGLTEGARASVIHGHEFA